MGIKKIRETEDYVVFEVNNKKITVKYDKDNFSSLPTWEVWETGNKKATLKTVKGSSFNAVNDEGEIYQEPKLVAEYFVSLK